jgi:DHA1 family bicyclomycin/chloramphenicol resistance-like MFS transporter
MAAMFSYVSGSSYVMQDQYGLSEQQFGLAFGAGAVGLIVSAQINVLLLERFTPRQIMLGALMAACTGVVLLILTAATHFGGLAGLLMPLWIALTAAGLIVPNAGAMALSRHGEAAGTAAAIAGSLQFAGGAVTAPLVGALGATGLAMATVMTTCLFGSLAALLFVVRREDLDAISAMPEPVPAPA